MTAKTIPSGLEGIFEGAQIELTLVNEYEGPRSLAGEHRVKRVIPGDPRKVPFHQLVLDEGVREPGLPPKELRFGYLMIFKVWTPLLKNPENGEWFAPHGFPFYKVRSLEKISGVASLGMQHANVAA